MLGACLHVRFVLRGLRFCGGLIRCHSWASASDIAAADASVPAAGVARITGARGSSQRLVGRTGISPGPTGAGNTGKKDQVWSAFRRRSRSHRELLEMRSGPKLGRALLLAVVCLVFGLAHAETPRSLARSLASAGTSSQFVFGDFDGDRKPDLATVHLLRREVHFARYSIRFELTSGIWQTVGVTAPLGGLQIVARDVNGDSTLDLVISTPWQHQAVAVLLNDGQGNFKSGSLTGISPAIWECPAEYTGRTADQAQDKSVLAFRWSATGAAEEGGRLLDPQPVASLLLWAAYSVPAGPNHSSPFGRAPPISPSISE
jgi:hypothetical protein